MIQLLSRRMMMGRGGGVDYTKMYLTTKALGIGTITFTRSGSGGTGYYSTDGGNSWTIFSASVTTPTLNAGDEVLWKCSGAVPATDGTGMGTFSSTCNFEVKGNIMSMQDGDSFVNSDTIANSHQFRRMFYEATLLLNANKLVLPATNSNSKTAIYANMFEGCTALESAPAIIALTTMTANTCSNMFKNCTSLTSAPELPAASLANYCYGAMFDGCSSLNYIKCLATTISATGCLSNWLRGVAASGTFVKAASMSSWPSGVSGIPSGWTVQNA